MLTASAFVTPVLLTVITGLIAGVLLTIAAKITIPLHPISAFPAAPALLQALRQFWA